MIGINNISYIDSLNFFFCQLSVLSKAFGLNCEDKGYFPHLFNQETNWNYAGVLPSIEKYGYNGMKPQQ